MVLLIVAMLGCTRIEPAPVHIDGQALGTTWSVTIGAGQVDAVAARLATEQALASVDAAMSTWRDDSELMRIRRGPGPVEVSPETGAVVMAALDLAKITNGAFDPTVQPLMELWGLHGEARTTAPTQDEVDAALAQVGWQKVTVQPGLGVATVDGGGTALDLSAIAKGHAVDRVSDALKALGARDLLVEVGGDVRGGGQGPNGPWRLGVDWPQEGLEPGEQLAAVVALVDRGMATSGNYRNTYEVDGVRVVHTLDPRTGRPVYGKIASATVVAPDCQTADGWATALMVLGPEAGMAAIEARPELEALLLVPDGDGFRDVQSKGMTKILTQTKSPMKTSEEPAR